MISRNRISQIQQTERVLNRLQFRQFLSQSLEERRIIDLSRLGLPYLTRGLRHLQGVPAFSALADLILDLGEHMGLHVFCHSVHYLLAAGPNVLQEHVLAISSFADGFGVKVDIAASRKSLCDNQRGASQIRGFHLSMHAGFEVPVSAQNCAGYQIFFFNRSCHVFVQLA